MIHQKTHFGISALSICWLLRIRIFGFKSYQLSFVYWNYIIHNKYLYFFSVTIMLGQISYFTIITAILAHFANSASIDVKGELISKYFFIFDNIFLQISPAVNLYYLYSKIYNNKNLTEIWICFFNLPKSKYNKHLTILISICENLERVGKNPI